VRARRGQQKLTQYNCIFEMRAKMCWTANKDDKLLYLQQLGEWYLPDSCGNNELSSMRGDAGKMADCCLAEPAISCHFIDKPSIVKCDESPNRDQNGKKFWN